MDNDINPRRLLALVIFTATAALGILAFALDILLPWREVDYTSWRALLLGLVNLVGVYLIVQENKPLPKFMTRDRNEDGSHD